MYIIRNIHGGVSSLINSNPRFDSKMEAWHHCSIVHDCNL